MTLPYFQCGIFTVYLQGTELTVRLNEPFLEEIAAREHAQNHWDEQREGHPEDLSETPPQLHRYLFACRALATMAYVDCKRLIHVINDQTFGAVLLGAIWDTIGARLEPADRLPSDELELSYWGASEEVRDVIECDVFCVALPPPDQEQQVVFALIASWKSKKPSLLPHARKYRYITLETGLKSRDGEQWLVWEWEKGRHKIFQYVPPMDKDTFVSGTIRMLAEE